MKLFPDPPNVLTRAASFTSSMARFATCGFRTVSHQTYQNRENGNRDGSQTRLGATATWTVDINNRVTFDGEYNYTYDAEGNLTWKYKTGEYIEYIYDHRNRLARVAFRTASSGTTWQDVYYRYDYQNRMIRRLFDSDGTAGGGSSTNKFYIHDGMQIVQIFDRPSSTVNLTDRLLWTDEVDYLISDERVSSLGSAGTVYWSLPNHLGTVVDVATYNSGTDTTTIAKHRNFDSFGNITSDSASGVIIVMGYTGKLLDSTTGLQNNINRWYAAPLGEWMTEDPIGFRGNDTNLHRYVRNAPVHMIDPTGEVGLNAYYVEDPSVGVEGWKFKWRFNFDTDPKLNGNTFYMKNIIVYRAYDAAGIELGYRYDEIIDLIGVRSGGDVGDTHESRAINTKAMIEKRTGKKVCKIVEKGVKMFKLAGKVTYNLNNTTITYDSSQGEGMFTMKGALHIAGTPNEDDARRKGGIEPDAAGFAATNVVLSGEVRIEATYDFATRKTDFSVTTKTTSGKVDLTPLNITHTGVEF